jgi:subtilisin family serine protease
MRRGAWFALLALACGGGAARTPASPPVPVRPTPAPPDVSVTPGAPLPDPIVDPRIAFAAGLMPLRATGVHDFLAAHPAYDGRGVLIAILDSGLDPAVPGLITTTTGAPKLLDVRDFSGEGRITLSPIEPAAGGAITLGGRAFQGAGRIARLATGPWYAGELRERPLGKRPASDVNGNGSDDDVFPVVVVRAPDGWVAFFDSNLNGSFEDEAPLHDYRQGRETIALGTKPLTLAANFSESAGRPVLDLVFDTSAHGTHVAGVAAGHRLYNVPGFNGVAPGAQLIGLKIANNARGGVTVHGSIMRAMRHAAEFAAQRGLPLVINVSFGVGNEPGRRAVIDSLVDAFARAHPQVVLVISAGNDGPGYSTIGFPGSADLALSVGSTYPGSFAKPTPPGEPPLADVIGWWSSRGGLLGKPDVLAPGVAYSTVPAWSRGDEIKGGTSFSAPHVAGLTACLISALAQERRSASAAEIIQALQATAVRLPRQTSLDQGFGVPQVEAAWRWLVAGHQGSTYVVRTEGGHSAVFRRGGYAASSDTLDRFRVSHLMGLRAARFALRADVPWLSVPTEIAAAPGVTEIAVRHAPGAPREPGVHVGTVTAYNPSDSLAGPLFRLLTTVAVPHDLPRRPLVDDARRVDPGSAQRYFLRAPRAGGTLRVTVTAPDSLEHEAIVRLFEPTGHPARTAPDDVNIGGDEEPGTVEILVTGDDFVPGVYELALVTPQPSPVTLRARAELSPLELARLDHAIEMSNAGSSSVSARVEQSLIGGERSFTVSGRGVPAESIAVLVPGWAERGEVDVEMDPGQWPRFTDFALTLFDTTGRIVANLAQNYAFGRMPVPLAAEHRGQRALFELFPAFANPDERATWTARVTIRFFTAQAVALAQRPATTVVAGGRVRVPLAAATALPMPPDYRPLIEVVATPAQGSPAVMRAAGAAP